MPKKRKKVVLVTGSSRGIGREIAVRFARAGFCVIVNYRVNQAAAKKTVSLIVSKGGEAFSFKADVSSMKDVKKLFSFIEKKFNVLDVLVNNAGYTTYVPFKNNSKINEKEFNKLIDVNLKSVFLCSRQGLGLLKKSRQGLIVNIASTSGITAIGSNMVYCAAKAGVISLTKSFARESGPSVRVNAIAPGYVGTDFIENKPNSLLRDQVKNTPLLRLVTPDEIAECVLSLYEDLPSMNGAVLALDGGRMLTN